MTRITQIRHLAALLLLLGCSSVIAGDPLRIAVAANFRTTLQAISFQYEARTGQRILLSSASTGALHAQIQHGAPFDLFFAADERSPTLLAQNGIGTQRFCYAKGKLALIGGDLDDLQDPSLSLAIANPAIAPYGRAAQDVLAQRRFMRGNERKLIRGNNVAQAYQFLHTGAVDLALVAAAQVPPSAAQKVTLIPTDWHRPLVQFALVITAGPAVNAYLKWLKSDTVRALIVDAGYSPCS